MSDELSQEELSALKKDIESAKSVLSSKEAEDKLQKAKEEGRLEAEKELRLQQALETEKSKAIELEKKLKDKELESAKQLEALQKRVDDIVSSKGVISNSSVNTGGHPVDKLTEEQVNRVEENSARAFFGPAYDRYGNE